MKRCTKCGTDKPLEAFHSTKRSKDGRIAMCKECVADRIESSKPPLSCSELLSTMRASGPEVGAVLRAANRILQYEHWYMYERRHQQDNYQGVTAEQEIDAACVMGGIERRRLESAAIAKANEMRGCTFREQREKVAMEARRQRETELARLVAA